MKHLITKLLYAPMVTDQGKRLVNVYG